MDLISQNIMYWKGWGERVVPIFKNHSLLNWQGIMATISTDWGPPERALLAGWWRWKLSPPTGTRRDDRSVRSGDGRNHSQRCTTWNTQERLTLPETGNNLLTNHKQRTSGWTRSSWGRKSCPFVLHLGRSGILDILFVDQRIFRALKRAFN